MQPTLTFPADFSVVAHGVQGILVHAARGDPTARPVPEYKAIIKAAKDTICASAKPGPISRTSFPTLVVGVSAPDLFHTIERCAYAHQLGADYVLVHAPVHAEDDHDIESYFTRVSRKEGERGDVPTSLPTALLITLALCAR